jgi:c(7)-type cytochrome triheme protein
MRAALPFALAALAAVLAAGSVAAEWGDITFTRKEAGTEDIPPAIFPHWVHRMQFRCHVCHDAITVMKAGANPITMEAIQEGKYCGACHNGKTAFQATFETCPRCHRR